MQNGDKPRLLLDSVILGIIGGLAAQLFTWMLRLSSRFFLVWLAAYQPPGLPEEGGVLREVIGLHGLWLIPVATTLGGLISGTLVYGLAPETEGHGTDTVCESTSLDWRRNSGACAGCENASVRHYHWRRRIGRPRRPHGADRRWFRFHILEVIASART